MRFVNWNVNGYRAVLNKGFKDFFNNINADIFSIQETKMQEGQTDINVDGYYTYMSSAEDAKQDCIAYAGAGTLFNRLK